METTTFRASGLRAVENQMRKKTHNQMKSGVLRWFVGLILL